MADTLHPFRPDAEHRPPHVMPADETAFLRAGYAAADCILEYGSGGSTVMASEMAAKTIFSVESDCEWIAGMNAWFDGNSAPSRPTLHHGDLGATENWGYPDGEAEWTKFHRYPLSVWDRADFVHPDVVLIDGRFRAACFLAVLFRIDRPVTVYFDDYADRPAYHTVERYGNPIDVVGRMARFVLEPRILPGRDLSFIMESFARPL